MLCAKYQEAGLSGSREKCDRNYLVSKFSYVHNIQSSVKQEVDMPQIQNCVTLYSSPYWCSVPNIKKLACVVPEKNMTEIFCDADDDDDARRQKWSLYAASAKAGRRHNNNEPSLQKVQTYLKTELTHGGSKILEMDAKQQILTSPEFTPRYSYLVCVFSKEKAQYH